jgi:hypothetical protein
MCSSPIETTMDAPRRMLIDYTQRREVHLSRKADRQFERYTAKEAIGFVNCAIYYKSITTRVL